MLIQVLDTVWKEHLYAFDHLRQGIGLRAYGQRDPLNEYKSEAFVLFNFLLDELKERVTTMLSRVEIAQEPPQPQPFSPLMQEVHCRAWLWIRSRRRRWPARARAIRWRAQFPDNRRRLRSVEAGHLGRRWPECLVPCGWGRSTSLLPRPDSLRARQVQVEPITLCSIMSTKAIPRFLLFLRYAIRARNTGLATDPPS